MGSQHWTRCQHWPNGRWTWIVAVCLASFYFFASVYIANARLLWYDEVFSSIISRLSPVEIWRAVKSGLDLQPPTYHLLLHVFGKVLGPSALTLRLPSALAMLAGFLIVFDCARRLTDGLHGLIAIAVLASSVLPSYGYEARPYALLFMWSACSLWVWLNTPARSNSAALAFGLTVFGAVTAHYYAVFCLVPYAVSTLVEPPRNRQLMKFLAGCAGLVAGLALFAPVLRANTGLAKLAKVASWTPASLGTLDNVYGDSFPHFLILFAVPAVIWIVLVSLRHSVTLSTEPIEHSERLAWFFLLIPCFGFVIAKLVTNVLYHKYFITMLPGVAVAFSCLLWRHFRSVAAVSLGILCLSIGRGIISTVSEVRHPERIEPLAVVGEAVRLNQLHSGEDQLLRDGRRFLVMQAESLLAIEAVHDSRHPEVYRLFHDPTLPRLDYSPVMEAMFHLNKQLGTYLPLSYWNLSDLRKHASEAALVNPPNDVLVALEQAGFKCQTHFDGDLKIVYLK
jgi:Dolichyl-phosphate-mannose-protein mannosyltransferase